MRHLFKGTTINIIDSVRNNDAVETNSVGERDTRYSSFDVKFMNRPDTPTPSKISNNQISGARRILSIGPPKHADMAIVGYPILATVTLATKSDKEFPFCENCFG